MTEVTVRTAQDDDWPQLALLEAAGFGSFPHPQQVEALRTMVPPDGAVVACDGGEVIGVAFYLDLRLTVPGGAVLPAAGISGVVVAPTHRRRGVLRAMYVELHRRIADSGYPLAALTASEGGIYGRFGYGPATVDQELTIDRRFAVFHPDAPDPGGVRLVRAGDHRDEFAAIYDRCRERTPGGLVRPTALWDDLLADREGDRDGGTAWMALLHPHGYALYRVHGTTSKTVRVAELRAVTAEAHAALWRALLGMDLMQTVVIGTYPDDPLPYLLTDTRLARTTARTDEGWLRLMDVAAALQARSYAAELSAVVDVSDGFRGDGGRFALDIRDGRAQCTPTDAPADAELDLDVLGSLYLGTHRATALAAANRLRCRQPGLASRLDAAFVSAVPAQLGFFF
ncbi:enhanced intracellular survival protein Eis [Mycolicibacter terrae]|uniref:Enhanced intracellular survival protein Eis n=1 Tax=Mycolicibacter terrae TaxID=1788 RepID=A0ACD2ES27_9MYCO|nr:enhanced intracellular survival protein Eis [Mycolicibacter terrae]